MHVEASLADDASVGRAQSGRAPDHPATWSHVLGQRSSQDARLIHVLPVHMIHEDHLQQQRDASISFVATLNGGHSACSRGHSIQLKGDEHLGVGPGGQGVHECAGHDIEIVDEAVLERQEVLLDQVGGAVVTCKAAGEAVVVEVVVLAQVGGACNSVKGARSICGDAQAVLVDELVLLAGHTRPKPAYTLPGQDR